LHFYIEGGKMKTKFCKYFFVYIIIPVVFLLSPSCNITPSSISSTEKYLMYDQVEKMPCLIMFEGFQPASGKRMKNLGRKISLSTNLAVCATSGNHDQHMPIIRHAYKHHQQICIAGYSTGEHDALSLAEDCEKEGINVQKLFLMDGHKKEKIHSNVKHAVDIVGLNHYMFRRSERYQKTDLENIKTSIKYFQLSCNHLDIPANCKRIILSEIPL